MSRAVEYLRGDPSEEPVPAVWTPVGPILCGVLDRCSEEGIPVLVVNSLQRHPEDGPREVWVCRRSGYDRSRAREVADRFLDAVESVEQSIFGG